MTFIKNDKVKIGWAIANESLEAPAYRRRFGYYLKKRRFSWEIADINKSYDIVVVHHSADLTSWYNYKKARIVFDYNDNYLAAAGCNYKAIGRGLAKYLFRRWSKLELNYSKAYIKMMKNADAIVCCTDAQEAQARKYCLNVFQVLDMQSDPDWTVKENYDQGTTFNLVWEGLPRFDGLKKLSRVIRMLQYKHNCALHVITSLRHGKYLNNVIQIHTKDEINRQLRLKKVFLYEWNSHLFSRIATACDLAIIPIDMKNSFWVSKPSNKLIFFWRMGMPTLVDPTPEYIKVMDQCGLDMVCNSTDEWIKKLEWFLENKVARQTAGVKAKTFVEENYNENKLLSQWDAVLSSIT